MIPGSVPRPDDQKGKVHSSFRKSELSRTPSVRVASALPPGWAAEAGLWNRALDRRVILPRMEARQAAHARVIATQLLLRAACLRITGFSAARLQSRFCIRPC